MTRPQINRRLVLFLVTTGLTLFVLWRARSVLTPFLIGLAVAYLIAPLVNRVQHLFGRRWGQARFARPVAILVVYGLAAVLIVLLVRMVLPPLMAEVAQLVNSLPSLVAEARERAAEVVAQVAPYVPPAMMAGLPERLLGIGQSILTGIFGPLMRTFQATWGALSTTFGFLLAFLLVPIWAFFVLNDVHRFRAGAMGLVPGNIRADVKAMATICDRVLNNYVRGQVLRAAVLSAMMVGTLAVLGVPYALLLGLQAGILALVPFVGTFIGSAIPIIVAFFISPKLALLTLVAFLIIQQIDNFFLSPLTQASSVALHPALIMVVVFVGQYFFGAIGLLIAVPLTAIFRDVVYYLYLRLGEEPSAPAEALVVVGYGLNEADWG